jgi:hypothetical protein
VKRCYLKNGTQLEKWGDVFYIPVIVACKQVNLRLTSTNGLNPFDYFTRNISMDETPNNERYKKTVERLSTLYRGMEILPKDYPYRLNGVEYFEWECKAVWRLR